LSIIGGVPMKKFEDPKLINAKEANVIEELRVLVNGRGHKEFFCLDDVYSPGSRIPAIDFSSWIKDKIREGDREALKLLFWELVKAYQGPIYQIVVGWVGGRFESRVEDGLASFKNEWQSSIDPIVDADISHFVVGDPEILVEIKALMFLASLRNRSCGWFVIATPYPLFLSRILIPWNVRFTNLETLVDKANDFILKMRKDVEYWRGVPLFEMSKLTIPERIKNGTSSFFLKQIGSFPFSTRLHFFDICSYTKYGAKPLGMPIREMTYYATRALGIDEKESSKLLINSTLVQESNDPYLFLSSKTKEELILISEDAGLPFSRSWNKAKLTEALMKGCRQRISWLSEKTYLGKLNVDFIEAARDASEYADRMVDFYRLVLGNYLTDS
jgi:hypothetical protein